MTQTPGPGPHADNPIVQAVATGYQFEGPALELGGLMIDATTLTGTHIRIPLGMLNRHGLVAGATGTGKTVSLLVLAEGFSRLGVPVFLADVKGDVAGLAMPGAGSDKLRERATSLGITDYAPEGSPVVFWDLDGKALMINLNATLAEYPKAKPIFEATSASLRVAR